VNEATRPGLFGDIAVRCYRWMLARAQNQLLEQGRHHDAWGSWRNIGANGLPGELNVGRVRRLQQQGPAPAEHRQHPALPAPDVVMRSACLPGEGKVVHPCAAEQGVVAAVAF
jgi:hypothetical protein